MPPRQVGERRSLVGADCMQTDFISRKWILGQKHFNFVIEPLRESTSVRRIGDGDTSADVKGSVNEPTSHCSVRSLSQSTPTKP